MPRPRQGPRCSRQSWEADAAPGRRARSGHARIASGEVSARRASGRRRCAARRGPGPQENTPGDACRADLAPGGLARPTFAAESRASDAPGAPGMTETKRLGDPRATKLARVHPRLRACWHRRRAARWPRSPPAPAARARNTPAATGHEYRLAAGRASHDRRSSAGFAVGGGDMRRHPPCRGPCRGPP